MNTDTATFEILKLQAEASTLDKIETMAFFSNKGVPLEIITRMDGLWEKTVIVAGQVLDIGRIIITKLIQFIKDNHNMAIGISIGVGLGVLSNMIPFIGVLISPVLTIAFSTIGGLRGHRLDKIMSNEYVGDSLIEDAITIAKRFWDFICEIFQSLYIQPNMITG